MKSPIAALFAAATALLSPIATHAQNAAPVTPAAIDKTTSETVATNRYRPVVVTPVSTDVIRIDPIEQAHTIEATKQKKTSVFNALVDGFSIGNMRVQFLSDGHIVSGSNKNNDKPSDTRKILDTLGIK